LHLKLQNDVHDFIDGTPAVLCCTFSTCVRRDLCHTLSAKICMKLAVCKQVQLMYTDIMCEELKSVFKGPKGLSHNVVRL
jgi:hypothetical protein